MNHRVGINVLAHRWMDAIIYLIFGVRLLRFLFMEYYRSSVIFVNWERHIHPIQSSLSEYSAQVDGILPKGPTRHAFAWQIGPFGEIPSKCSLLNCVRIIVILYDNVTLLPILMYPRSFVGIYNVSQNVYGRFYQTFIHPHFSRGFAISDISWKLLLQ